MVLSVVAEAAFPSFAVEEDEMWEADEGVTCTTGGGSLISLGSEEGLLSGAGGAGDSGFAVSGSFSSGAMADAFFSPPAAKSSFESTSFAVFSGFSSCGSDSSGCVAGTSDFSTGPELTASESGELFSSFAEAGSPVKMFSLLSSHISLLDLTSLPSSTTVAEVLIEGQGQHLEVDGDHVAESDGAAAVEEGLVELSRLRHPTGEGGSPPRS